METIGAYGGILAAAAPFATQLASSASLWPVLFVLFALPALSLCLSVATLSRKGPIRTFATLSPVASGIGWALTLFALERILIEVLRASQTFLYIIFSLRTRLDWALDCGHSYNTHLCSPFDNENATHEEYHHYPDNFWPAQEFNQHLIRGYPINEKDLPKIWEPNQWFLGRSTDVFYPSIPSIPLVLSHLIVSLFLYAIMVKFSQYTDQILTRLCIFVPTVLYFVVIVGLVVTGFPLGSTVEEVLSAEIEKVPQDFWTDLKGFYRTSLLVIDYSTAFTGISLVVVSRLTPGARPLVSYVAVPFMMIMPILLKIIVTGCEGHISKVQPAYKTYVSTDEMFSFDVIPVCLASRSFGPLWALLFYVAHFLYTSLAPLIIYTLFMYTAVSEQFPFVHTYPTSFYSGFFVFVSCFASILYMPLGTKVATFLRYATQSSTVHLIIFVVVFFVYGWQTLETDITMATNEPSSGAVWKYFVGPRSPINTALQFTLVPAMLCTKGVAVYDLLLGGNDVLKHIDAGTQFIAAPLLIRRLIGYIIMLAPLLIVLACAIHSIVMSRLRGLSLAVTLRPSTDWLGHQLMQHRPKPYSLAYVFFNKLRGPSYHSILLGVLILEIFFFVLLACLLLIQIFNAWFGGPFGAANFRSLVMIVLLTAHALALIEMRAAYNLWDDPTRLTLYVAMATLETAFLNGYMWMFAFNHEWGTDWTSSGGPLFLIITNTALRSLCICATIAVRAHIREVARPSRTRDATEIYGADGPPEVEMDAEDDAPIIFDLARA